VKEKEAWEILARRPEWQWAKLTLLSELERIDHEGNDGALRELNGSRKFASKLLGLAEQAEGKIDDNRTDDPGTNTQPAGKPRWLSRRTRGRRRAPAP
jgi:hypothetical protein